MNGAPGPATLELFGTRSCPYTAELRERLCLDGRPFVEYDVEADASARQRLLHLTGGRRTVPVLVDAGVVRQVGWRGRGCTVD